MTDPIADMLTRIKNAYLARKIEVNVPHSNVKEALANLLVREHYIEAVEKQDSKPCSQLKIKLRYVGKRPAMTSVQRISKPGRRVYESAGSIPRSLGGYGITVVSTSSGLLSDKEAKKKNIGGEVICAIW
ncbi:30S ribosomal protein S8 [Candidatus Cerribacteria bacterium 'Amazon FNV 2010 28 9']|uniref:Small ribosomal subunit protein uS8 n=1 Tax=Candidatus Cerribacteria bacterium 'Amazon FNV 2010 28 9' TaxID=2081795 RepID=A0A317JND5_9BACT|nr:MAG: 30S ribosomal protein S8 [Candidatus Cerribacteria bacterium 'Amazon FNV 2010 28 9']